MRITTRVFVSRPNNSRSKVTSTASFQISWARRCGAIRLTAKAIDPTSQEAIQPGQSTSYANRQTQAFDSLRGRPSRNRTSSLVPSTKSQGRLWNLHEFGGIAKRRRKPKRHRFRCGRTRADPRQNARQCSQVCSQSGLQTAAQASRASRTD